MSAGRQRALLHFQRREAVEDDYGNTEASFVTVFTDGAELIPLKGSESVIAARLTGTQPYVVRVRSNSNTRAVGPAWRILDARNPSRVFNITAIADMTQKNAYLDIMATEGVVT